MRVSGINRCVALSERLKLLFVCLLNLSLLFIIDASKLVDKFLFLPGGPNEVTIGSKALFTAILPPVALLEN